MHMHMHMHICTYLEELAALLEQWGRIAAEKLCQAHLVRVGLGVGVGAWGGWCGARSACGEGVGQARTANIEASVAESPPPPETAAVTCSGSMLGLRAWVRFKLRVRTRVRVRAAMVRVRVRVN